MSSAPTPESVLPPRWQQVLEVIEHSLDQALAGLEPDSEPVPPPPSRLEALAGTTQERLGEHLEKLEACVGRAQRDGDELDTLLGEAEEELSRWLTRAAETRRRLADGVEGAV